jgi:hypothetical protein
MQHFLSEIAGKGREDMVVDTDREEPLVDQTRFCSLEKSVLGWLVST